MFKARAERIQDSVRAAEARASDSSSPMPTPSWAKTPSAEIVSNDSMFQSLGIQVEKVTVPKKG